MKNKTDLFTSIIAAIIGVLISFFVTNLFIGPVEEVSFKEINSSVNANLADPDPEIFNYKALNPTVEVYVGECVEYNKLGECVEVVEEEDVEEQTEEENQENKDEEKTEEENKESVKEENQ